MDTVTICRVGIGVFRHFSGYLLPSMRQRLLAALRSGNGSADVFGALWNEHPCAAAAVEWDAEEGAISSLYVDPKARRHGIAGRLLTEISLAARRRGVPVLTCSYVLRGEALSSMDLLFFRQDAEIRSLDPVCCVDSRVFYDSPLFGAAMKSGFQVPERAVLFSALTEEQRKTMDSERAVPDFLNLSRRGEYIDPDLSAAWVEHGVPVAWGTACQTGAEQFAHTGFWRGPDAPEGCLRALLCLQANRARYRCGGDFTCFFSAVNERSKRAVEKLTGGNYELYAHHIARLDISGRQ